MAHLNRYNMISSDWLLSSDLARKKLQGGGGYDPL